MFGNDSYDSPRARSASRQQDTFWLFSTGGVAPVPRRRLMRRSSDKRSCCSDTRRRHAKHHPENSYQFPVPAIEIENSGTASTTKHGSSQRPDTELPAARAGEVKDGRSPPFRGASEAQRLLAAIDGMRVSTSVGSDNQ
jgi:hypothetical protein